MMKSRYFLLLTVFLLLVSSSRGIVYRVPIQGTIDLGLPPYIERAIDEAEINGAGAIIFDIDTFGGRIDAATRIKDAIMDSKVTTVAFINRRAISAGALISLSCEKIIMTGGGTIGAATAVDIQGKKASEKVISYMREEMASTAEERGRNVEIAKGMVDEELRFTHLIINGDSVKVTDLEGRKEGKLITLTTETALKYNFADDTAETFDDVLTILGLEGSEVRDLRESWSEKILRFLTEPTISSLLMTIGFLGILFELQSPGWGIPGTIGVICLTLFFGTSIRTEMATTTELLFILVGVVLLLIEVLLIPGFGIVGVMGGVSIFAGFFLMLVPEHPLPADISSASWGFAIGIIGGIIALVLLGKFLIRTKFWQRIILPISERSSEGYSTSIGLEELVGHEGMAVSDLRPSGWVTVGEKKIFVVSEGEFVTGGEDIKILSVDGNRVVVRKISSNK
ncbi:MAG: nodulation protein NfeD [Candidatus Marinimicrobia bacterium]|nr:nodulation protein NfeD [Candidatus Neomarinimicrobiota bacterium]